MFEFLHPGRTGCDTYITMASVPQSLLHESQRSSFSHQSGQVAYYIMILLATRANGGLFRGIEPDNVDADIGALGPEAITCKPLPITLPHQLAANITHSILILRQFCKVKVGFRSS